MQSETEKKKVFVSLMRDALAEMKNNQTILLKRGDLFREDVRDLYKRMYEEIEETHDYLAGEGTVKDAYRYLQLNVFMKHESFFMDLFETNEFPVLFELFEFV